MFVSKSKLISEAVRNVLNVQFPSDEPADDLLSVEKVIRHSVLPQSVVVRILYFREEHRIDFEQKNQTGFREIAFTRLELPQRDLQSVFKISVNSLTHIQ